MHSLYSCYVLKIFAFPVSFKLLGFQFYFSFKEIYSIIASELLTYIFSEFNTTFTAFIHVANY